MVLKNLTVPSIITSIRFLLLIPLSAAIVGEEFMLAAIFFSVIIIGDGLDGYLARKLHQETDFGKVFDGIVDGFSILLVLVILILKGMLLWYWTLGLFLPRIVNFVLQSLTTSRRGKIVAVKTMIGKVSAVSVFIALLLVIVQAPYSQVFLSIATILTIASSIVHARLVFDE